MSWFTCVLIAVVSLVALLAAAFLFNQPLRQTRTPRQVAVLILVMLVWLSATAATFRATNPPEPTSVPTMYTEATYREPHSSDPVKPNEPPADETPPKKAAARRATLPAASRDAVAVTADVRTSKPIPPVSGARSKEFEDADLPELVVGLR